MADRTPTATATDISWCERTSAVGNTWHLRPLTDTGRHLGGGIDTDSFCGRVVAPYGWDCGPWPVEADSARRMAATVDHTGRQACPTCVEAAFPSSAAAVTTPTTNPHTNGDTDG